MIEYHETSIIKWIRGVRWLRRIRTRISQEQGLALHCHFMKKYDDAMSEAWHSCCELEDELMDSIVHGI